MNRVSAHVAKVQEALDNGGVNGALDSPEKVSKFEKNLDIDFTEHFAYQNAQARAHVSGKISSEEAQIVYAALGEVFTDGNGGWAAGTSLATKVTVTNLMAQLIGAR